MPAEPCTHVVKCRFTEGGQLYSYAIPPGLDPQIADAVLIRTPKDGLKFLRVEEIEPFEKQKFQLKPILAVLAEDQVESYEQWAAENT